jgi:hypothetical protein
MAITYEQLKAVNDTINKIDVKGKGYAQVNDRVKAFRQLCPMGTIETEIIALDGGVVTMKATVTDDEGHILGTGMAQEKESSSFINKTSFIENCETSAVGRALGFAGIGVDGSMASAEEVANAMLNQGKKATVVNAKEEKELNDKVAKNQAETISDKEKKILKNLIEKKGLDVATTFPNGIDNVTGEQYTDALNKLNKLKDKA